MNNKNRPKNAGKPWNDTQRKQLLESIANKVTIEKIAEAMGRSPGAIRGELKKLKPQTNKQTTKKHPKKAKPASKQAASVTKHPVTSKNTTLTPPDQPVAPNQKQASAILETPVEKTNIKKVEHDISNEDIENTQANNQDTNKNKPDIPQLKSSHNQSDTPITDNKKTIETPPLKQNPVTEEANLITEANNESTSPTHKAQQNTSFSESNIKKKPTEQISPSNNALDGLTQQINKSIKAISAMAKEKSQFLELDKQITLIKKELAHAKEYEDELHTKTSNLSKKYDTAVENIKQHSLQKPHILARLIAKIQRKNILQDWLDKMVDITTDITHCLKNTDDTKKFISDVKNKIVNLKSQQHLLSNALKNSQKKIDLLSDEVAQTKEIIGDTDEAQALWAQENKTSEPDMSKTKDKDKETVE